MAAFEKELNKLESILKHLEEILDESVDYELTQEKVIAEIVEAKERLLEIGEILSIPDEAINAINQANSLVASISSEWKLPDPLPAWEKKRLEKDLFGPLSLFAKDNGLEFIIDKAFWAKKENTYFGFKVDDERSIIFQCKAGWKDFIFGVKDKSTNQSTQAPLTGLKDANALWPYGWQRVSFYKNWTPNDLTEIYNDGDGRFIDSIIIPVISLKNEMRKRGII